MANQDLSRLRSTVTTVPQWQCMESALRISRSTLIRFPLASPTSFVLIAAFAIRFSVAVTIAVTSDGTLFPDDDGYLTMAGRFASGDTENWDEFGTWGLWNNNAGFLLPIGILFRLFGFHPLLGQTLSVLAGAITAAAVTALVHRHTSATAALCAGLSVAVFPSQILWSSLVLKDSFSWMALTLLAVILGWWAQKTSILNYAIGFLALSCLMFFLVHLRSHTFTTVCIAAIITLVSTAKSQRTAKVVAVMLLLAVLPLTVNAGIFSRTTFAATGHLGGIRSNMAAHARTAIGAPSQVEEAREIARPEEAREIARLEEALKEALKEAREIARPEEAIATSAPSAVADLLYLPTGLRVMLLDPLPNHLDKSSNMKYAFAEHLLWYPLLLLGLIGMVVRRKSLTPEIVFTLLVTGGLTTMWALVEGNFGTAYRHRGELVWGVAVLAGIGLDHLLNNRRPYSRDRKQDSLGRQSGDTQQSSGMGMPPAP